MMKPSPLVGIDGHCHLAFLGENQVEKLMTSHPQWLWVQGGYDASDWSRQRALQKKWGDHRVQVALGLHPWLVRLNDRSVKNLNSLNNRQYKFSLKNSFNQNAKSDPKPANRAEPFLSFPAFFGPGQVGHSGIDPPAVDHYRVGDLENQWNQLLKIRRDGDWIGETGLDFFKRTDQAINRDWQIQWFQRHLEIAKDTPVIIHSVRAHGEVLRILDGFKGRRGLVHDFRGSLETAREYRRRGFVVSIGPAVLNPKNQKLRKLIFDLPWGHFVLESDSPSGPTYGDSHDNGLNQSLSTKAIAKDPDPSLVIKKVITEVASIKGEEVPWVQAQMCETFCRHLF